MNQEEKYKEITKLIGEYNEVAIKENSNIRLGLASSESYKDDEALTHEEFIKENYYYENAGISIDTFGTDGSWFPSSVCN